MNRKQMPPPPPLATPEDLAAANAMCVAFGYSPHSEKNLNTQFAWSDEAKQIFYRAELMLSHGILRDHPGFKTLSAKSPVAMTVALVHALQDDFLSLKLVTKFDHAWHRLELMGRTLGCATDALEMIRAQAESQNEESFLRLLKRRIDFAQKSLKQLREFVR